MSRSGTDDPIAPWNSRVNAAPNLAAFLDSTSDLIWAVDLDYRLVIFNAAFAQHIAHAYGVPVAVGMPPHDVFPGEVSGLGASSYDRALSAGRFVKEFELRSGRVLELAYHPLWQDGKATGISVFGRDITERKAAEKTLRMTESKYRAVFEGAVLGIFRFEPDRRLSDANPALAEILGYDSPEELIRTVTPAGFWADPAAAVELARLVSEQEIVRGYECQVKRKDGASIWVSLSSRRIYGADGNMAYYQGFLEDISQRKRIDEALRAIERDLRKREEFLRLLLDASPAFIIATDARGRVLTMNRSLLEALEYTPEEVQGKSYIDTFVPETARQIVREAARQLTNSDQPRMILENRIVSKSGRERLVAWHGRSVVGHRGVAKLHVAVGIDITEMREIEEHLRHSQKIEAIGQLAGGVAHDFNNLLTVIIGYSRLALAQLPQGDPLRNRLDEIYAAGQRGATLTRQLLAFSRKQVMQPRAIDLNHVVRSIATMLRRLVGEDVDLVFALAPGEVKTFADPNQIEQVIVNLAVNARDAMPGGGKLTIETAKVEATAAAPVPFPDARSGWYAVVAVRDTGTGMDEATRSRIFEPFFTTKETGKGTGLGLSMVQGIVAQSDGYVSVDSEAGKGATFKVFLPLLIEAAEIPSEPEVSRSLRGHETVLVVEDQPEVRRFVVAVLTSYGYRALGASNPREALRICEQGAHIDLVLTDMVMPDMSGPEFVGQLKSAAPDIQRAMFMSGYAEKTVKPASKNGIQFIQKPFSPAELTGKVREVLDGPATL